MVMNAMNPFAVQTPETLSNVNEATLMALAQQGNPNFTHAMLMEQAAAQQQMQGQQQQQQQQQKAAEMEAREEQKNAIMKQLLDADSQHR